MSSLNFNLNDWLKEGGSRKLRNFVLDKSYARNSWVFACVRAIGNSIASVPIIFYDENGELIENKDHPVLNVFRVPKSFDIPSLSILIRNTVMLMELRGGCHWIILKSKDGLPENIQLKQLNELKPMMRNSEILWWVLVNSSASKKTYRLGDVVTFKEFSPNSSFDAVSPLMSSRLDVEQDFSMAAWNASFFDKGAKKDIIIEIERPMNKEQRKEFIKDLISNRQGVEAAHGYLLLTGGAKGREVTGIQELSFNNSRQFSREAICAAFGVPPAIVGIFRYANYANSKEQRNIFWEQTLFPKMQFIKEQIQVQFLDRYFPGCSVDWDYKTIKGIRKDSTEQAQSAQIYYNMGYTREEIAQILDAPELIGNKDKVSNNSVNDNVSNDVNLIKTYQVIDKGDWWINYSLSVQNILTFSERRWIRAYNAFCKLIKDAALKRAERLRTNLHILEWTSYWEDMSRGLVKSDWELGGSLVIEEERNAINGKLYTHDYLNSFSSGKIVPLNVLLPPDEVESFYASMNQVLSSVFKVGHDIVNDINSTLIPLLNQGASLNDIAKELSKWYEGTEQKALILARNISGTGYNTARYTMMNNRRVEKHRWVNSGDEHVRQTHVLENTHEVKVGDRFPITRCRYPHDPTGALKEIVNCRCTTVGTVYRNKDRFVPAVDSRLPDVVEAEGFATIKQRIINNPIFKELLKDVVIEDVNLDALTQKEISSFDEWLQRQQSRTTGLRTREQVQIIKIKDVEDKPGSGNLTEIKSNLRKALKGSNVDISVLRGLTTWEKTIKFGNFSTGRFVKVYSEIGDILNKLNLGIEIKVGEYRTLLDDNICNLVNIDKVKSEIHAGQVFKKNYEKRVASIANRSDVRYFAKECNCKINCAIRTIKSEKKFFNAIPKVGDIVDLPYCSASHLGYKWQGNVHILFDLPDDAEWWDKNVLFTKLDLGDNHLFFDSFLDHWSYNREEEIVLKNHWQVSKIKKLGSERVYIFKPIKEEDINNMLKKQGKSVIKIDVNRVHRPAMTLSDIEEEKKAKDKVREWCKEHWERVKEDYNIDGTDAMMTLMYMYPNYRKPN